MSLSNLITFKQDISNIKPPSRFTYPFCYSPDSLAKLASEQLQQMLTAQLANYFDRQGRMFGVLVVRDQKNQLGFLSAISGNNADLPLTPALKEVLVPNIVEGFENSSHYVQQQQKINQLNLEIETLKHSQVFELANQVLTSELEASNFQISRLQQEIASKRQYRKQQRQTIAQARQRQELSEHDFKQHSIRLAGESVYYKNKLRQLKSYWQSRKQTAQQHFDKLKKQLNQLTKARKQLSTKLQKQIFKQYQLLNKDKKSADILEIFNRFADHSPPSGSGDCAAPKLLQFAFLHNLEPISMAEFWWGKQPKSEIRKHGHFYPSCQTKCKPILQHMLNGIPLDNNPVLDNPAENILLEIVYQDNDIVVVNKPSGLLSVPGKHISDSVCTRIKQQFSQHQITIVHRLDMSTSGLMVLSLNTRAHKNLQKQFNAKQVTKQYIADVVGLITSDSGIIKLPLRGDINDRPRQLVCHQHGKYAETHWRVIAREKHSTRLQLTPITGRTHQLRVHCAHPEGLNLPIVGDDLYGTAARRLHLHAQQLEFTHPITKQALMFETKADF